MSNELLRLSNISKSFSGVSVLEDISLTIEKGKVISIVGENGAGKSTLANIISGSLQPDSGMIYFQGQEMANLTVGQAKDMGISMVHQELMLLPQLDITSNIFIGNEYQNHGILNKSKMKEKCHELLEMLEIDIYPETKIVDVDISRRQMVEIARACIGKPSIILLDEPTSSLSEKEIQKLFEVVNKLKKKGVSFVFVSHRLKEVLEISDYIYVLKDGKLMKKLNAKNTNEDEIIVNMVGRNFENFYNRRRTFWGKEALRIEHYTGIEDSTGERNAHTPKDINLCVGEGEVLGISGLVGAGRTELVRLIFGEDKKKSGNMYLFGEKTEIHSCRDAYDKGMAWVTEDRKHEGLILEFDVKRNMVLPILRNISRHSFINRKQEGKIVDQYIRELNVKTSGANQHTKYLSGGNQQKVVLAKWLASEPKILVLDEPTRGIDVNAKYEIYSLINKLTAQGMAVILISSELMEVIGMSDRIVVMHDGVITGQFNSDEFSEEEIMSCSVGRHKDGGADAYEKN